MAYLSPGKTWQDKLKLKNEGEAIAWRSWWLKRCAANRRVREGLLDACRHDLLLYTNLFVWQYNPRAVGHEVGPFVTWPFQDVAFPFMVKCIEEQVNLACEKSKDMGLSWMNLIVADWLCRFHTHKQVLCISKSEQAVESESPNSLFWKIDFMHSWLPEWLHQPDKFRRRKLFYGYPSGSTITGEASTGRAGVGGRATALFVDEFALIKEDWEVLHRTSDTAYSRIFNSTHQGLDTAFYKICYDRDSFPARRWKKLVIHWSDHPLKRRGRYRFNQATNQIEYVDPQDAPRPDYDFVRTPAPVGGPFPGIRSPWYDDACADKGSDRAIAMDLDINPQGSIAQFFDPIKLAYLKAEWAVKPYWEGDLRFDADMGTPLELIPQEGGPLRLWLHANHNKVPPGRYALGVDLSSGNGATNSCVSVLDCALGEKVASYTSPHILPENMAPLVVALCKLFADENGAGARLVWENPGPGLVFGGKVLSLGYRNIYYRTTEERTGPKLHAREKADTPGWFQSNDGKRWLMDRYRAALEGRKYLTREAEELDECLNFRWTNDGRSVEHSGEGSGEDPSGARVNHGDRVMGAALAWMLGGEDGPGMQQQEAESNDPPPGSLASRRQMREYVEREPEEPLWLGGIEYR